MKGEATVLLKVVVKREATVKWEMGNKSKGKNEDDVNLVNLVIFLKVVCS